MDGFLYMNSQQLTTEKSMSIVYGNYRVILSFVDFHQISLFSNNVFMQFVIKNMFLKISKNSQKTPVPDSLL